MSATAIVSVEDYFAVTESPHLSQKVPAPLSPFCCASRFSPPKTASEPCSPRASNTTHRASRFPVVDPEKQTAWQYHSGGEPEHITTTGTLTAGHLTVLPTELFSELPPK